MNQTNSIAGFVLYDPEDNVFVDSVRQASAAGLYVIIFDNSPSEIIRARNRGLLRVVNPESCTYLTEKKNIGLSSAFNRILDCAKTKRPKFDAVLFFDQDSVVESSTLTRLHQNFRQIQSTENVGVYAALALGSDGQAYRIRSLSIVNSNPHLALVKFAPSSFALIPRSSFDLLGVFHDDFFIDHIDVDFCQRCRRAGLGVIIDKSVTFQHNIGTGDMRLGNRRLMPLSSPFRIYYQSRNIILSYRRGGANLAFMLTELFRRLAAVLASGFSRKDLSARLKYYLRGVWDGLIGRGGALPQGKNK